MLKSPKELNAIAQRAAERRATQEAKVALEFDKLEHLRKDFEATCLAAALLRRGNIFYETGASRVVDLRGFAVEEVKRDWARERFLASKMAETEKNFSFHLEALSAAYPELIKNAFPNRLAKDFRELLDLCVHQEKAEDVVASIRRQLSILTKLNLDSLGAFESDCLSVARERLLLEVVRSKHAKVAALNAAIPDGLDIALRVSWDAAVPAFEKVGIFSACKLKWISNIWPRWERHFNADIERVASSGRKSCAWLFSSAGYFGEENLFAVDVVGVQEPDIDFMSVEQRRNYFYWKEIEERDCKVLRYDEEEGLWIGVHPLPVAEIFTAQGFQVRVLIEDCRFEDDEGNYPTREIEIADLEGCSVDLNYRLEVDWGKS
jgi:hypothetical protein